MMLMSGEAACPTTRHVARRRSHERAAERPPRVRRRRDADAVVLQRDRDALGASAVTRTASGARGGGTSPARRAGCETPAGAARRPARRRGPPTCSAAPPRAGRASASPSRAVRQRRRGDGLERGARAREREERAHRLHPGVVHRVGGAPRRRARSPLLFAQQRGEAHDLAQRLVQLVVTRGSAKTSSSLLRARSACASSASLLAREGPEPSPSISRVSATLSAPPCPQRRPRDHVDEGEHRQPRGRRGGELEKVRRRYQGCQNSDASIAWVRPQPTTKVGSSHATRGKGRSRRRTV